MRSESGAEVAALDCGIDARVTRAGAPGGEERTLVPRLENDTNTILKVNRDRQCSEWLSCAEDQASWDERTNSWKTVCTDIELCTEYSSLGGSTFCSDWKSNEAEIVLDNEIYTARDISWYGQDYSGYAIPDLFPVQTLEQANVSPPPGYCDLSDAYADGSVTQTDFESKHGTSCSSESDCAGTAFVTRYCVEDDKEDYRLALVAGSCDGNFGDSCSVGFCENTGAACSNTEDCGTDGGSCIVGNCQVETLNSSGGALCASDSDCSDGDVCSGTVCVTIGDNVDIEEFNSHPINPDLSCAAGEVFASHIALQTGSCIREQCILTPDGKTFDVATTEGKLCRAHPETDSPFSYELVERWADPDAGGVARTAGELPDDNDDVPYEIRTGFENSNFCAPGEDCECTYRKLTFGTSGPVRYWDPETEVSANTGICTSGTVNKSCTSDPVCDTDPDEPSDDGICTKVTREDVLLGLDGYCLEKDTGVNVNGDRAQGACLTWLPVDQLAGSTDMYAKFTEAGYFEDTFACSYTSPMANLLMSDHDLAAPSDVGSIACAQGDKGEVTKDNAFDLSPVIDVCAENSECPSGYWTMMGMPSWKDGGIPDTTSSACHEAGTEGNDCPYVCIPLGATVIDSVTGDTESCDPDNGGYVDDLLDVLAPEAGGIWQHDSSLANDVKFVGSSVSGLNEDDSTEHYQEFDAMIAALELCSLKGVQVNEDLDGDVFNYDETDGDYVLTDHDANAATPMIEVLSNDHNYRELRLNAEFYPACEEITRVVHGGAYAGYAWTDRLLGQAKELFAINSTQAGIDFTHDTRPQDFGFMQIEPIATGDEWPVVTAACEQISTSGLVQPLGVAPFNSCSVTDYQAFTTDDGAIDVDPSDTLKTKLDPNNGAIARSLIGFNYPDDRTELSGWEAGLTGGESDIFNAILQLFAGVNLRVDDNEYSWNAAGAEWPSNVLQYEVGALGDYNDDESGYDDRAEEGSPPTVWSLLSGSCIGTQCEEGDENSLTLNDQNSGDVGNLDLSASEDAADAGGFFRAYLKFYAAANENQLPIRRVIVDWGDGVEFRKDGFQGSDDDNNFYKNHRGLDNNSETSICDLYNEWGTNPTSCDPNYFSYSHIYTCDAELIAASSACTYNVDGVATNSPCTLDSDADGISDACVFQPAVHVRDNWGWCTGVCTTGSDGEDGCYEGDSVDTLADRADPFSECAYEYERAPGSTRDPWVYYDGQVIVDLR
jgi:hypothetical protein